MKSKYWIKFSRGSKNGKLTPHYSEKEVRCYADDLKRRLTPSEIVFKKFLESKNIVFKLQEPVFIPSYGWIIPDFLFPEIKFLVEVDGGVHLNKKALIADRVRDRFASQNGWQVFRIKNEEVHSLTSLTIFLYKYHQKIEKISKENIFDSRPIVVPPKKSIDYLKFLISKLPHNL